MADNTICIKVYGNGIEVSAVTDDACALITAKKLVKIVTEAAGHIGYTGEPCCSLDCSACEKEGCDIGK